MFRYRSRQTHQALLDDLATRGRRWCNFCNTSYKERFADEHMQSARHRAAARNFGGMKRLATSLWEKHRGAPVSEPIAPEKEREILKYTAQQRPQRLQNKRRR